MNRLFFLVLPFLFAACAVQNSMHSGAQTSTPVYKIEILWQIHTPYCGGAYPSPDQATGWDTPNGNQEFVILMEPTIDPNKEYQLKVYSTDSDGIARLELPKGTYYIFSSEKFESIEALEKKYKPTGGAQVIWDGIDCLKQWQSTSDFSFEVTEDKKITFTKAARCFEGTTPCINYVGPYPP
jgi:hypothetical protein